MTGTPNGVAVRDLRVLLRSGDGISTFRSGFMRQPTLLDVRMTLTVTDGTRRIVAKRAFTWRAAANAARARFVSIVEMMSDGAHEHADWQAVLDAV